MAPALDPEPSHGPRARRGVRARARGLGGRAVACERRRRALSPEVIQLTKHDFHAPARELLPPIDRYARLAVDGEERLAGYVEASHGCVHKCRHCPVPVVYDGRIRIVGADTVLDDIARLVDAGARHITFGDPDFLNGWRHSRKVVRAMNARFPDLTFDCTTKVEHILEHAHVWPEFADAGCLFVISALESLNDGILERLDKGHVAVEAEQAITPLAAPPRHRDAAVLAAVHAVDDLHRRAGHPRFRCRPRPGGQRRPGAIQHPPSCCRRGRCCSGCPICNATWGRTTRRNSAIRGRRPIRPSTRCKRSSGRCWRQWPTRTRISPRPMPRCVSACARCRRSRRRGSPARGIPVDAERAAARPRLTEAWFCCAEPTELQFAQLAGI